MVTNPANDTQLWQHALAQLELKVSKGNFLTWFRETTVRDRAQGVFVLETASPFAYEWLSKKYKALILETLQSLDKEIEDLQITVALQSQRRTVTRKNMRVMAQKAKPVEVEAAPTQVPKTLSPPIISPFNRSNIPFNPKYTLNNFIVGTSNEIANAACRAVVDKPGEAYNPLFIYGGVGLGKTHLLQAVGNELLAKYPHFKILYVASEKFMNDFVEAIRERKTQQFKKNYRDTDVFIIDDVQFLAGKGKTQEELFHTFNTLYGMNKQVILSSDRPPTAIATFQERLSSRLASGMITDIKKPDYETRLAILEEKVQSKGIDMDHDGLSFIAKNIQSNVRELEGALNRVLAHCELHNKQATVEYTKKILHDILDKTTRKTVNTDQIIHTVSTYYNLAVEEICGKRRNKEIVRPRQIAMYLLRKENNMSFPSIGEYFGGRDHTTAMHACEKIEKLLEHDDELNQEIGFLKERIYA